MILDFDFQLWEISGRKAWEGFICGTYFFHGMSYCNGAMNAVAVSMCIGRTVKVQGQMTSIQDDRDLFKASPNVKVALYHM